MSDLTVIKIIDRYSNFKVPVNYIKFIENLKEEKDKTNMYKLKGVLNIGLNTELTSEILESASELYDTIVNDETDKQWIDKVNNDDTETVDNFVNDISKLMEQKGLEVEKNIKKYTLFDDAAENE